MKQNFLKKTSYWLGIAVFGTILGLSLQFVKAWTEPTAGVIPPNGNVGAPINSSPTSQHKEGRFSTGANGLGTTGSLAVGGNIGVGAAAISNGLKVDVEGRVGATEYCDQNGEKCFKSNEMSGVMNSDYVLNSNECLFGDEVIAYKNNPKKCVGDDLLYEGQDSECHVGGTSSCTTKGDEEWSLKNNVYTCKYKTGVENGLYLCQTKEAICTSTTWVLCKAKI